MTPDDLDSLSDEKLSEVFAVEVAQIIKCDKWAPNFHPLAGLVKTDCGHENCHPSQFWPPRFATSADAVMPWLEKQEWSLYFDQGGMRSYILTIEYPERMDAVEAETFARAACIALILAKRASKP